MRCNCILVVIVVAAAALVVLEQQSVICECRQGVTPKIHTYIHIFKNNYFTGKFVYGIMAECCTGISENVCVCVCMPFPRWIDGFLGSLVCTNERRCSNAGGTHAACKQLAGKIDDIDKKRRGRSKAYYECF